MDPHNLANENALNEGNHDLRSESTDFTGESGITSEISPATAHPSLGSDAQSLPTTQTVVAVTRARRLDAERSEPRRVVCHDKFYHSRTSQPMSVEQVTYGPDSDDEEIDHDVADLEDRKRLDAKLENSVVDVSEVEKNFMLMWNSFVRKRRIMADGLIPWGCEEFSRVHEKELLACSSLAMCWRLFMVTLWNYGILDANTMNKCNTYLENCRLNNSDTTTNSSGNNRGGNNNMDNNNMGNINRNSSNTDNSSSSNNTNSSVDSNSINMSVNQGDDNNSSNDQYHMEVDKDDYNNNRFTK